MVCYFFLLLVTEALKFLFPFSAEKSTMNQQMTAALLLFGKSGKLERFKVFIRNAPFSYSFAWIGLWDDPNAWKSALGNGTNSWRWSATGETSKTGYKSWNPTNPNYYLGTETCVNLHYDGTWTDVDCSFLYTFICYNCQENKNKLHEPASTV
uniref:C-type lectin domain-containing protein n=1 Tax=Xiphophorus couchianus TaxID=32473 RepID=A0A3B5M1Y2_9TELE